MAALMEKAEAPSLMSLSCAREGGQMSDNDNQVPCPNLQGCASLSASPANASGARGRPRRLAQHWQTRRARRQHHLRHVHDRGYYRAGARAHDAGVFASCGSPFSQTLSSFIQPTAPLQTLAHLLTRIPRTPIMPPAPDAVRLLFPRLIARGCRRHDALQNVGWIAGRASVGSKSRSK